MEQLIRLVEAQNDLIEAQKVYIALLEERLLMSSMVEK